MEGHSYLSTQEQWNETEKELESKRNEAVAEEGRTAEGRKSPEFTGGLGRAGGREKVHGGRSEAAVTQAMLSGPGMKRRKNVKGSEKKINVMLHSPSQQVLEVIGSLFPASIPSVASVDYVVSCPSPRDWQRQASGRLRIHIQTVGERDGAAFLWVCTHVSARTVPDPVTLRLASPQSYASDHPNRPLHRVERLG